MDVVSRICMLKTLDGILLSLHDTREVGGIDPILQMGRSRHGKVTWLLGSRVAWRGVAWQQGCAPAGAAAAVTVTYPWCHHRLHGKGAH